MPAGVPHSLGTVGAGLPAAGWATGVGTRTARGTESAETDVGAHRAGQVAQYPPGRKGRCGRSEPHSVSIPSLLRPGYYAPCSHGRGSCLSLSVQSASCAALSPRLSAVVSPPAPPLTTGPQNFPSPRVVRPSHEPLTLALRRTTPRRGHRLSPADDELYQRTRISLLQNELPQAVYIDGYNSRGFTINGNRVFGPCALLPQTVVQWNVSPILQWN